MRDFLGWRIITYPAPTKNAAKADGDGDHLTLATGVWEWEKSRFTQLVCLAKAREGTDRLYADNMIMMMSECHDVVEQQS